ncbi:MAG: helix-turn-helix transcriptional regulator [Planctomycetales bacterium]|nr:helix-turn-helix transcriptional regulator [Planctomycetales bacterium]
MKKRDIRKDVGDLVRELRTKKGWSQEELAFRSGLHRNYIGGIERGERNVAILNVERLAKALGVRPRDLLP